jgi:hypothetical protein
MPIPSDRQHLPAVHSALADPAADLRARWLPTPFAIAHATALLDAEPSADIAIIPMIQPGKTRGIWTTGQEVRTIAGVVFIAANDDTGNDRVNGYQWAREACRQLAGQALADSWKAHSDADRPRHAPGTTAHAVVTRDGNASVFEDF